MKGVFIQNRWATLTGVLLSLFAASIAGCANGKEEMSRAQQEIDTRHYQSAIDRLEKLAKGDPDIKKSDEYVDLLSSAYLGRSGVDLINTLGHWGETYKAIQNTDGPLSFMEYKSLIGRLTPPESMCAETPALQKALTLCNDRLLVSLRGTVASKRVLVKTIFVNFWGLLAEIGMGLIPAVDKLMEEPPPHLLGCRGFDEAKASVGRLLEYETNIALAIGFLGDSQISTIRDITRLSKLTGSFKWLDEYSSCEQLSNETIEKIKKRFTNG